MVTGIFSCGRQAVIRLKIGSPVAALILNLDVTLGVETFLATFPKGGEGRGGRNKENNNNNSNKRE
jgi:hypothetical protein